MLDLTDHEGRWSGTWATWLRPDELHDESPITAEVSAVDGGWSISYRGSIGDDDVTGRMVASADGMTIDWTDTWHTEGVEQHLVGDGSGPPSYDYGPDDAPWTWAITIAAGDELVITHTNQPPGFDPVRAVEMRCRRSA